MAYATPELKRLGAAAHVVLGEGPLDKDNPLGQPVGRGTILHSGAEW